MPFEAEHSDQDARLVYVKPSTKEPVQSNLVMTMQSGETISLRLLSDGSASLNAPVDFIVDYKPQQSFFVGSPGAVVRIDADEHLLEDQFRSADQ